MNSRWGAWGLGLGLLLLAVPARAEEVALDGSLRLRGLYSFDDGGYPAVGLLFLDTDARGEHLTSRGLRLQLDATFILDATEAEERRFGRTESLDQVRQLYVEQPALLGGLDLSLGRQLVAVAGNAWVDGLQLELHLDDDRAGLGVYGGFFPDPIDYAPTAQYQSAGVYGVLSRPGLDGSLAYNSVLREGALDRHFVFNRVHYRLTTNLFVASYLVVDLVDSPQVTTFLGSLDFTPTPAVNLTVNFSRFAVEQYRNQTIYRNVVEPNQALVLGDEIVDLVYNRVRLSASFTFWGHLYHYQSIEAKHRAQDQRTSFLYTIGVRDDDFLGTGATVDLSGRVNNDFQSDSYVVALDVDRDLSAQWSLAARATVFDGRTVGRATERGRLFDEAQLIYLLGGGLFWRPAKSHQLDVDYDLVYEAELQDQRNQENLLIHTGMGRYSYFF